MATKRTASEAEVNEEQPVAKRSRHETAGIVALLFSPNAQAYRMSERFLCELSPVMETACSAKWSEEVKKKIKLEEIAAADFQLYLKWATCDADIVERLSHGDPLAGRQ